MYKLLLVLFLVSCFHKEYYTDVAGQSLRDNESLLYDNYRYVSLNKKQRELLEEFAQLGKGEKNSPESQGFFAKVKVFFDDIGK